MPPSAINNQPTLEIRMLPMIIGDLKGITAADLPDWCDMTLMLRGDPKKAVGGWRHVMWDGFEPGLFYTV